METPKTISIKEYLTRKGIVFLESGKELIARCLFSSCDNDSQGAEAHLYFNVETSQYDCKKCGTKGNIYTLAEHLGDSKNDVLLKKPKNTSGATVRLNPNTVEQCNREMPEHIRKYLNNRGISDEIINEYSIGYGNFYGQSWITIPVKNNEGKFSFLHLRRDPARDDDKDSQKYKVFPFGSEVELYGWETLQETSEKIVICEGDLDRLGLMSKGIPAITSTGGAQTFKKDWLPFFAHLKNIYVAYDHDKTGDEGSERVLKMFLDYGKIDAKLFRITLPEEVGEHGDITDYFVKLKKTPEELFSNFCEEYPERPEIDMSQFSTLYSEELIEILGLTIKKDETNKLITFLCELSAYTENSQVNISYIAPSSTGKSYIPMETATLFPKKDVIEVGYVSPTAFFHDTGKYNPEKDEHVVDLSKKIMIFLDQPHTLLLQHLRPFLSHDKKELSIKITDKNKKGGNKTKNIILKGFPAVIFCTAGLKLDEQEATRFLLLSPETSHEKIRQGIDLKIRKEADQQLFKEWIESDSRRRLLKERIETIKQAEIGNIKLECPQKVEELFLKDRAKLKPKHQRDIGRIIAIIKCFALLNFWLRKKDGSTIIANEEDIEEGFKVWARISESQELNIPPFLYNFYYEIILPAWRDKNPLWDANSGTDSNPLMRKDVLKKHREVYGRILNDWFLRQQILPVLENSGLIIQEPDPSDKRRVLIQPIAGISSQEDYSELDGGVNHESSDEGKQSDEN